MDKLNYPAAYLVASGYLLFAHPVVHLLSIPVEELKVHALLILLPAHLPQLQQRLLLLGQDAQLQASHMFQTWNMGVVPV